MKEFWDRLLTLLEKYLPGLILAFGLGHRLGKSGKTKLEKSLSEATLEIENLKAKEAVRILNAHKSDDELVRDAIRKGRDDRDH